MGQYKFRWYGSPLLAKPSGQADPLMRRVSAGTSPRKRSSSPGRLTTGRDQRSSIESATGSRRRWASGTPRRRYTTRLVACSVLDHRVRLLRASLFAVCVSWLGWMPRRPHAAVCVERRSGALRVLSSQVLGRQLCPKLHDFPHRHLHPPCKAEEAFELCPPHETT